MAKGWERRPDDHCRARRHDSHVPADLWSIYARTSYLGRSDGLLRAEGQRRCAKFARATHVKTFGFNPDGTPIDVDAETPVCLLQQAGYSGTWGVESVPRDGDEIGGVRKTIELIRRLVGGPR